jgi:hypothetical protein
VRCGICGTEGRAGETYCALCGTAFVQSPRTARVERPRRVEPQRPVEPQRAVEAPARPLGSPGPVDGPRPTQPPATSSVPGLPTVTPNGKRRVSAGWIVALIVVIAAAAGGLAIALSRGSPQASPPVGTSPGQATISTITSTAPTPTAPLSTAITSTTGNPVRKSPSDISFTSPTVGANPEASAVSSTFETYVGGIDARNFAHAYGAYSPSYRANVPLSAFIKGDGTSRISFMTIDRIVLNPDGSLTADVTFTSHQAPADGPVPGQTCTNWDLAYHLVPSPAGDFLAFLIEASDPIGPGHTTC